jgi:hypothetical protein
MKTLNVAKTCGIVGTILTFLFVLALTASCTSGPEGPKRTIPKFLSIKTSVSGLKDETILVTTRIYNMDTGEETISRKAGNGPSEIGIREPEEGNVYTITAEAEGHTVYPESYKVRITEDDTTVITNNENGEEVSQLDFQFTPAPPSELSSQTPESQLPFRISRELAIETATRGLPPSVVARADIQAEIHGWYWEITFDNLNAEAEELMPYPLKDPPPPPPGQPTPEPYPGIWQRVIITVDAETGDPLSAGASKEPKPGPYVSREQAISSARERIMTGISETWLERAKIEAYLRGDIWIVLFWEEDASVKDSRALDVHRFRVSVDAVTGAATGFVRG